MCRWGRSLVTGPMGTNATIGGIRGVGGGSLADHPHDICMPHRHDGSFDDIRLRRLQRQEA